MPSFIAKNYSVYFFGSSLLLDCQPGGNLGEDALLLHGGGFLLGAVGGQIPHLDTVDLEGAVSSPSWPPLSLVVVEFR